MCISAKRKSITGVVEVQAIMRMKTPSPNTTLSATTINVVPIHQKPASLFRKMLHMLRPIGRAML
jgi:hypothetical protein